jgi:L-ascorbate metabolism protein UlaG (beta-lactamase superfamily)
MMPEQTIQAAIDLKSKLMMPIHWGSFKLALHDWKEPIERAVIEAKKRNVKLVTPMTGESILLHQQIPQSNWWLRKE